LIFVPLLLAAAPATREADDRPISLPEAKARETLRTATEFAGLPIIHAKSIDEVLKLSLKDNDLQLDTALEPVEQAVVQVPRIPGMTRVKFLGAVEQGKPVIIVQYDLENRDYTVPNAIAAHTSASFVAGTLTLTQLWETVDDETYSVQLLQNPVTQGDDTPHVVLYVQNTGSKPPVDLKIPAASVVELRRSHPAEVAKYVDPIFRALRQDALLSRINPRLAWQVFADHFTATPELQSKVKLIVAKLDAEKFQDREAASRELEALDEPAALLLMRQGRNGLSEEQSTRIDAFLSTFRVVSDEEAARYRRDRDFLIDCLGAEDQTLRALAAGELAKVAGTSIEFDPAAPPAQRDTAVEKIRQHIGSPTTTQYKE
jgi:hypothetical protein